MGKKAYSLGEWELDRLGAGRRRRVTLNEPSDHPRGRRLEPAVQAVAAARGAARPAVDQELEAERQFTQHAAARERAVRADRQALAPAIAAGGGERG